MRQGWLTLITLAIASTIAGAEILHQINGASQRDINDFLKNIPPEIGFKYESVTPALTIQGMNIHNASFHLGKTQFFFKKLCLGHPHIEENILKFSSVAMDHAKIVSGYTIFSARKGILRNFEVVPSAAKKKKWDDLVFDENTLEENESFTPVVPESKEIVTSFFSRFSNQKLGLGNIRFGRVQFEKVKVEKSFKSLPDISSPRFLKISRRNHFALPVSDRTNEIIESVKKEGFIIPSFSVAKLNIEGYGTGSHPLASFKDFQLQILYNLLSPNFRNPNNEIRKLSLSLEEGEIHEGGNLLQRPRQDEVVATHQFWDDPEKFFNTAPYGLTLLGIHGSLQSPTLDERSFNIPKITGERRLSAVNDRWAFKSYFDLSEIETNLSNWPKLSEDVTTAFTAHDPSLRITSVSVPKDADGDMSESWVSKLTLELLLEKQNEVKASFALRYPPTPKNFFQGNAQRLAWENSFRMSNLSLTFSGADLPPALCASWHNLKKTENLSCSQISEILHEHALAQPDFEKIVDWIATPQKKSLQATLNLSHFWEWYALPPREALTNLPLKTAKTSPL